MDTTTTAGDVWDCEACPTRTLDPVIDDAGIVLCQPCADNDWFAVVADERAARARQAVRCADCAGPMDDQPRHARNAPEPVCGPCCTRRWRDHPDRVGGYLRKDAS